MRIKNFSLDQLVTRQARNDPGAVAIVGRGEQLAYGELEAMSTRIARTLLQAGVQRGDRVCLLVPKSPRAIAAILGVLKAGAIYVPLDPHSPALRLAAMVRSCETPWIIACGATRDAIESLLHDPALVSRWRIGWIDGDAIDGIEPVFDWDDVMESSPVPLAPSKSTEGAYLLFTSGSTGTPKGVMISHANVDAFLAWAIPYFGIGPDDRLSGHPPLHFDLSVFDIFGALAAGAQLHLATPEVNLLPAGVVDFIADREITQWFSVPGILSRAAKFDVLGRARLPSLRRVIWCGEVLPTPVLRYWMTHLPRVRFTNLYGPTETTIASSFYTVPECPRDDAAVIPIGEPCVGEELLVLDDSMRPAPVDALGELYIGGAGLSRGYWRDDPKTAAAFVPDPRPGRADERIYRTGDLAYRRSDGLVVFVGRTDSQVKVRGHRVEIGEVESALSQEPRLLESVVVAVPTSGFDGVALCCGFVTRNGSDVTTSELRHAIAARLPAYMIPTRWKAFGALPRTASGKVDRRAIQAEFTVPSSA